MQLEKTIVNYSDNLKLKEKELLDFELKLIYIFYFYEILKKIWIGNK